MLTIANIAWKFFKRECYKGEWLILFFALMFATATVTALSFYTDRINMGIRQQSNRILGGDLAIVSDQTISPAWEKQASQYNLQYAQVWSYLSIAKANGQFQLMSIQAVSDHYPLYDDELSTPALKTIWVEPRVLSLFNIALQDKIMIGSQIFTVTRTLKPEFDKLSTGWIIAPRLIMQLADVPSTNTVIPGSRVEYRLLLKGSSSDLNKFRQWIVPQLKQGQRLVTVRDQQTTVSNLLDQAENYLQFIILVSIVMSGVVIALSVAQYVRRHSKEAALWRCLGMQQRQFSVLMVTQLGLICLVAGLAGILLGYVTQHILSALFSSTLPFTLGSVSVMSMLKGFVTSIFLLFAFSYPLIVELPRTPPLYLWRGEKTLQSTTRYHYLFTLAAGLGILLYWIIDVSLLTLLYIDTILLSIGALYALNIMLMKSTQKIAAWFVGGIKRGLCSLIEHHETSSLQFIGLTLILICIFMLGWLRLSLIDHWKHQTPNDAPNYFVFNIASTDITSLSMFLKKEGISIANIYPMARGRLVKLNNQPILDAIPISARNHNTLRRELNLSWMWSYPEDNIIVDGRPWSKADKGKNEVSIELSMAKTLHLRLGDRLTFLLGDHEVTATIVNFRTLTWSSFHPNFYVIFPPGLLDAYPATYITSFYLPDSKSNLLNSLMKQYPNVTVVDLANIFQQIQSLIDKITTAIQYLFLFSLGSGLLMMVIAIQSSLDERQKSWRLLRILGASRRYISLSIFTEFSYLLFLVLLTSLTLSWFLVLLLGNNLFN